nr:aldo/keto reductase [uncultured Dysosmobacter sp.]
MIEERITLNNGITMPKIGYGVFRMMDAEACEEAVVQAIHAGYRLIDTAAAYGNEEAVGKAIRRCGVAREELFITTKLWITDTSYEGAKRGFERSMEHLGLDYLDLYLIHQPYNDYYGAWRALEELYAAGKVRAIGVDNFTPDKLADFVFWNKVKPAVDLVECNPFFQREDERAYMESKDIQMQAWSPLSAGQANLFRNETLCAIAASHQKTVAQVALRWLTQRGIVPIVKSANPQRMKENLSIFDFTLTEDEMRQIAALDTGYTCFAPRQTGSAVDDFLKKSLLYQL